jgi:N-acetylglucosamine kinase-like BadF-type ATPase
MEAVYVGRLAGARLSELAPVVFKAAAAGDGVAQGLIGEMEEEIVVTANAAIRRLRLTHRDVHVVLGGGVLRAADAKMIERITAGIREVAPAAVIRQLDAPPVVGAALMGLDELHSPAGAAQRVREALTDARLAGRARLTRRGSKP